MAFFCVTNEVQGLKYELLVFVGKVRISSSAKTTPPTTKKPHRTVGYKWIRPEVARRSPSSFVVSLHKVKGIVP